MSDRNQPEERPFGAAAETYVAAYRREELEAVDATAALQSFRARLAQSPIVADFDVEADEADEPASGRAMAWWVGGAVVAAVAAGLLLWRPIVMRTASDGADGSMAADAVHGGPDGETPALREDPAPRRVRKQNAALPEEPDAVNEPDPPAAPLETLEPSPPRGDSAGGVPGGASAAPRRRGKTPRRNGAAATPAAPVVSPRLERELQLIAGIRGAAKAGEHKRALKLVDLHARTFPKGALAPERDLIELESLCALQRHAALKTARTNYAKTHRGHHLARKASQTCIGED